MVLPENQSRILLLTICAGTEFSEIGKISLPIFENYCTLNNYELMVLDKIIDPYRPPPWSKIIAILKYLSDYDYILWVDSDCLIMRNIPITNIIKDGYDLTIGKFPVMEGHHLYPYLLHTGAFIIKNTEWSHWFLRAVYDRTEDIMSYSVDETAVTMVYRLYESARSKIDIVDHRKICSMTSETFDMYKPDSFIRHFARMRYLTRLKSMEKEVENSYCYRIQ